RQRPVPRRVPGAGRAARRAARRRRRPHRPGCGAHARQEVALMRLTRALRSAAVRALYHPCRHPASAAVAVGAIAVAFCLLGMAHLAAHNLHTMNAAEKRAHMIVYLEDGTSAERGREIAAALAQLPAVEATTFIGPDEAQSRLRAALGDH